MVRAARQRPVTRAAVFCLELAAASRNGFRRRPAWGIEKVVLGLQSFMVTDDPTHGAVEASSAQRRNRAARSLAWNCSQPHFRALFPELVKVHEERKRALRRAARSGAGASASSASPEAAETPGTRAAPAAGLAATPRAGETSETAGLVAPGDATAGGPADAAAAPAGPCGAATQWIGMIVLVLLLLAGLFAMGPSASEGSGSGGSLAP